MSDDQPTKYSCPLLTLLCVPSAQTESVVNTTDGRTLVDRKHHQGFEGKYRGIVKLYLLFEKQVPNVTAEQEAYWAIATGWLVSGDVVVTAGHCAYDYDNALGRLIRFKAYMGYEGRHSIKSSNVEHQYGLAVATTPEWINTDGGDQRRDVAFIKLNRPFKTVKKFFTWEPTPISQGVELVMVGYPGDLMSGIERGAKMYEMFKRTDYNLVTSPLHMLQYKIDMYGGWALLLLPVGNLISSVGNSGSPVIKSGQSSPAAIGVHVLGGYNSNSASVIGGCYGQRCRVAAKLDSIPVEAQTADPNNRTWLYKWAVETTE
ncbi:trypsin-like cysteine/serine peptidase domain-containing protein [Stachybotrys elegans]|uniref:Serine protease n=1 Tax=Stachybotrys elegans TaxID=80388 RepID=A0A8K0WKK0_9HYPO|nr:trypsin-like cysteine/serine peptidase domain-containing protein [Stachybotrys elegans]